MLLDIPADVLRLIISLLERYERVPLRYVCKHISTLVPTTAPYGMNAVECATDNAAKHGHLVLAKWLYGRRFRVTVDTFSRAAQGGSMEMISWLVSIGCKYHIDVCVYNAAHYNRREALEWARPRMIETFGEESVYVQCVCRAACEGDQFELLKETVEKFGIQPRRDFLHYAITGHSTRILEWLHEEKGLPWCEMLTLYAVERRAPEIVKWLREQGCPWNTYTFKKAIAYVPELEFLKWLRADNCPWGEAVVRYAVNRCVVEDHCTEEEMIILEWLLANGCPFLPTPWWPPIHLEKFPLCAEIDKMLREEEVRRRVLGIK
jgi:ferredoxin